MSFTLATALIRLSGGSTPCFPASTTQPQQLQVVNECLERFFIQGEWRGLKQYLGPEAGAVGTISISNNILTLPAQYYRLDKLGNKQGGCPVDIKSQEWAFSSAGPGPTDWTMYPQLVAIDMGENASFQRQYFLTGDTTTVDALNKLAGLARLRYVWATVTTAPVIPDNYRALKLGVLSILREEAGDNDRAKDLFAQALAALASDLGETDPEDRVVSFEPAFSGGQIRSIV